MEIKNESSMTFTCVHDYYSQPKSTISVVTDATSLSELLTSFEDFLRGCGYHFSGSLEIIEEESQACNGGCSDEEMAANIIEEIRKPAKKKGKKK